MLSRMLNGLDGTVAVMGSLNADYSVRCARLPKPGETVSGEGLTLTPGGKSSNQAACAAKLGANVAMVGAVGTDDAADFLIGQLEQAGADVLGVERLEGPSGSAVVEVDAAGENSIVVSPGSNGLVTPELVERHADAIRGARALGLCLEVPMDAVIRAAQIAHEAGVRVLLNDSPFQAELPRELIAACDVLLVNQHELAELLGMADKGGASLDDSQWQAIAAALGELGFYEAIVTLGGDGSVVLGDEQVHRVAPVRVGAVDTTGCGDAFMGAVLAGLASGRTLAESADVASYVGAYAACGHGAQASYGTPEEILAKLA